MPQSFEQYVAKHDAETPADRFDPSRDRCTGCLKRAESLTVDGYCAECMRYQFGYDQAEDKVVTGILEGAVRGALEAEVHPEKIVLAVMRALEDCR